MASCAHIRYCIHEGTPLTSFVDLLFLFVSLFDILPCLCRAALWSPAGKGLTSRRLTFFMCFCHFPIRYPGSGVVLDCHDRFLIFVFFLTCYSHEYRLARNTVYCAILSEQIVFGCLLGVPISYYLYILYVHHTNHVG